jgi:hypothetical protein
MARPRWLCPSVVLAALTLVACTQGARTPDEAPPSLVLREVFFTNVVATGGRTYRTVDELGPRLRRFDPDRDEKLVLIAVFDPRYTVKVSAALLRPDGQQYGMFEQTLQARLGGTWHTVQRWWPIQQLRRYPGEWQVKLWVDNRPMGQYYFLLGPEPPQ